MADVTIRGLDDGLVRKVKILVACQGVTMKEFVTTVLVDVVEKHEPLSGPASLEYRSIDVHKEEPCRKDSPVVRDVPVRMSTTAEIQPPKKTNPRSTARTAGGTDTSESLSPEPSTERSSALSVLDTGPSPADAYTAKQTGHVQGCTCRLCEMCRSSFKEKQGGRK
jgi:plasmid stability protein